MASPYKSILKYCGFNTICGICKSENYNLKSLYCDEMENLSKEKDIVYNRGCVLYICNNCLTEKLFIEDKN